MAANVYDPTIIAIEVIQSLQNSGAQAGEAAANQASGAPNLGDAGAQAAEPAPIIESTEPETGAQPTQSVDAAQPEAAATGESGQSSSGVESAQPVQNVDAVQTETVATTSADASPISDIGPFGWVGIGFLFCLVFALILNIYLKRQKKDMDHTPDKAELSKFAPGAMAG